MGGCCGKKQSSGVGGSKENQQGNQANAPDKEPTQTATAKGEGASAAAESAVAVDGEKQQVPALTPEKGAKDGAEGSPTGEKGESKIGTKELLTSNLSLGAKGENSSTLSMSSAMPSAISRVESSSKHKDEDSSPTPSTIGSKIESTLDSKLDSNVGSAINEISTTGSAISLSGSNMGSRIDDYTPSKLESSTGSTTGFNYDVSATSTVDSSIINGTD